MSNPSNLTILPYFHSVYNSEGEAELMQEGLCLGEGQGLDVLVGVVRGVVGLQ